MYEYVSDSQREAILAARKQKESLLIGQGGEGYIGEELWCYNCGDEGHLGDVSSFLLKIIVTIPTRLAHEGLRGRAATLRFS